MRPIRQRDRGCVREALALYARHFLYVCTDTEIACSADWLGFNLSRNECGAENRNYDLSV